MSSIPIKNLYYLLSYAWSDRLSTKEIENSSVNQCNDLAEFFAHVLTQRLQPLLRRGLDRSYILQHELTSQPRGRINFTASVKNQTWLQAQMHCTYDELSPNVLLNQVIKTTLSLLYFQTRQKQNLKATLHEQLAHFEQVSEVQIRARTFRRIQLHRNNRKYSFILHLCELIHSSLLPEHDSEGNCKFKRLEANEGAMPAIFEQFVYAFARRHLSNVQLPAKRIQWQAEYHTETTSDLMPTMNTDLTIHWKDSGRKLILDCKYYKKAFTSQTFGDREYNRFKTNNLYQVFAYLINKREITGWEQVEGMLLYPTTTADLHEDMTLLNQHRMQICSINLNQDWQSIKADLISILMNE